MRNAQIEVIPDSSFEGFLKKGCCTLQQPFSVVMKTYAVAVALTYCLIAPAPAIFSKFSPSISTSVGACLTP